MILHIFIMQQIKMKQQLLHKYKLNDKYEYVRYDKDTWHYILNRIIWKVRYEEEERDYIATDRDLMFYINTAMDDDTELMIIRASEAEWCPDNLDGYFIY